MDINPLFVNAIGFVATLFSIFMWVPQARITWQNRNDPIRLAGVSEITQWLSTIGYLLWGVFGVLIGSLWVAAPSVVSFPLSIATILVVRRGRKLAPFTRTVPILSTTEPLAVADSTGSVPILSTDTVPVPSTGAVPILSSDSGPILSTGTVPICATGTVPIFATGTVPILSSATSSAVDDAAGDASMPTDTYQQTSTYTPTTPIPVLA